MRKFVAVLILLLCSTSLIYAQKARYGQPPPKAKPGIDYPLTVHITGVHVRPNCTGGIREAVPCEDLIFSDAIMNGKKIELIGYNEPVPLRHLASSPADYPARLMKDSINAGLLTIGQKYELVFP